MSAVLMHRSFEERFIDLVGLQLAHDKLGIPRRRATRVLFPVHWILIRTHSCGRRKFVRCDELLLACLCLDEVAARPREVTWPQLKLAWLACNWDRYAANRCADAASRNAALRTYLQAGGSFFDDFDANR